MGLMPGIGMVGKPGIMQYADGQFMVAVSDDVYISTDFGATWIAKGFTSTWKSVACSSDGKYILVSNGTNTYLSNDRGNSWSATLGASVVFSSYDEGLTMSNSGQYIYILQSNYSIKYSNNYGSSWSTVGCWKSWGLKCSGDGRYILIHDYDYSNKMIRLSSDYGLNFTTLTIPTLETYAGFYSAAISNNGNAILVGVYQGTSIVTFNRGATWTLLSDVYGAMRAAMDGTGSGFSLDYRRTINGGTSFFYTSGAQKTNYSYSGQYVLSNRSAAGQLFLSSNYGSTFTDTAPSKTWTSIAIGKKA